MRQKLLCPDHIDSSLCDDPESESRPQADSTRNQRLAGGAASRPSSALAPAGRVRLQAAADSDSESAGLPPASAQADEAAQARKSCIDSDIRTGTAAAVAASRRTARAAAGPVPAHPAGRRRHRAGCTRRAGSPGQPPGPSDPVPAVAITPSSSTVAKGPGKGLALAAAHGAALSSGVS